MFGQGAPLSSPRPAPIRCDTEGYRSPGWRQNDGPAGPQFRDSGTSFDRVHCPACATEIAIPVWREMLEHDDDADAGAFTLLEQVLASCGAKVGPHQLGHECPQDFSRDAVSIMNPMGDETIRLDSEAVGMQLQTIWRHL